ncbi:ferric reductase-like transmembrane domain-containing protein [Streptomyces xanthochromogenes]|uniref:ferric reductase-like transmembrane domain-containing protein n=1 Tax=Streptomyces xanthochromogenes TaxID=67384 RepID=UPI00382BC72A
MTIEATDPQLAAYPALSAYLAHQSQQPDQPGQPGQPAQPGQPDQPEFAEQSQQARPTVPTFPTYPTRPSCPLDPNPAFASGPPPPWEPPQPNPERGGPTREVVEEEAATPVAEAVPVRALRIRPRVMRRGMVAGAGAVSLLWGSQAEPSARLDALFAGAAHLSGLLAGYGILVMLLLMARVPAVEHGVGADRLARWHSLGGRYVLSLVGAHVVLALCGYAAYTGTDLLRATAQLLGYGGIVAAAFGTLALGAAGVSSVRAARARISQETWRALHFLTYLGAALAFAHQLVGPDVSGSPLTVWAWAMLHATVAVLIVWYRGVVPVRQALRHGLRVVEVRDESPDVVSVVMRGTGLDALRAEPGQFLRWRFVQRRLWHTSLPFSLSAPVRDDTVRITVKALGVHSRRMRRLRPGTRVLATGPFGAMTAHRRTRRKVLLLAGGVGITPMRVLFETLPAAPGDLTLLYRASNAAQLVLRDELEAIAVARGAALHYLLGPSDASFDPLAPQALRNLVPDLAEHDVYLCGPGPMAAVATASLIRAGVPEQHIHTEQFSF